MSRGWNRRYRRVLIDVERKLQILKRRKILTVHKLLMTFCDTCVIVLSPRHGDDKTFCRGVRLRIVGGKARIYVSCLGLLRRSLRAGSGTSVNQRCPSPTFAAAL